jgi:hypothetical protein
LIALSAEFPVNLQCRSFHTSYPSIGSANAGIFSNDLHRLFTFGIAFIAFSKFFARAATAEVKSEMVYAMIATVTFRQPLNFAEVDIREEFAEIFLLARISIAVICI